MLEQRRTGAGCPRRNRRNRDSAFWDRIANWYARSPVPNEDAYRRKLDKIREYLRPDTRLLEIGCGTGSTAIALAPSVAHVEAVDFSERMIAIAREKAAAAGVDNVEFRQAGFEDVARERASCAAVMMNSLLHLLPDPDASVARVFSMLRCGGLFISTTPCIAGWMSLIRPILLLGNAFGLMPRVKMFGRDALLEGISAAGFVLEHVWQPEGRDSVFVIAVRPPADA